MPTFPFKRPRIISKKFPEMDSTIDGVTKSLNELVFSYAEKVDRALQKKHLMMAFSSLVLLLVLGSFISPRGKAEGSVFYPETCLGGWVNPQYAQGEPETTSNGDESQFTKHNSAVLPKNTNAEMYCGNFKGKFDSASRPTKIIVSLAMTKGPDLSAEDTLESGIGIATTTDATSTDATSTVLASSTEETLILATSTIPSATTTATSSDTSSSEASSSSSTTEIPIVAPEKPPSIVDSLVNSVKDSITTFFAPNTATPTPEGTTDTVVVPPPAPPETTPAPSPAPAPETPPTSLLPTITKSIAAFFFQNVFAQEATTTEVTTSVVDTSSSSDSTVSVTSVEQDSSSSSTADVTGSTSTPLDQATTTIDTTSASSTGTSTIEQLLSASSSTPDTASSTEATSTADTNQFQNNFLEIFYTFDGVTWVSFGELNEISMKYRTFEIPVTATTSWSDLSKLQVKVVSKKHTEDTPTVYLDGVKVEVLYETTFLHAHPDFARDTILSDETSHGMRIVSIINNETSQEEIWYMYLDDSTSTSQVDGAATSTTATSMQASTTEVLSLATSTLKDMITTSSSTQEDASSTVSTSTRASTFIKPIIQKNVWMKFQGRRRDGITIDAFAREIQIIDENKLAEKIRNLPDFTLDIIKRIKGSFLHTAVVQLQKDGVEELWLYDLEKGTEEKIDTGSSTSLSVDSPLGIKDGHIFWLSDDGTTLSAYTITTKAIEEKPVPSYDASQGERAEVVFPDIPWKVIVSANGFSFYSEQTGEVFSDDDGTIVEELRQKLKLDAVLTKEELSKLNLQVEDTADDTAK